MPILLLDMPDEVESRKTWLERVLVGPRLIELVDSLEVIAEQSQDLDGSVSNQPTLNELLGDRREQVLARGMTAISESSLGKLIEYPSLLLELQELVLTEGGPFWIELCTTQMELNGSRSSVLPQPVGGDGLSSANEGAAESRRTWLQGALGMAAAAMLAVGIYALWPRPPVPSWGFADSDLLNAQEMESQEYFALLSQAAGQWYNSVPADSSQLAQRLSEFSAGCELLINASHEPLKQKQRDWLTKSCKEWQGEIDSLRQAVAANQVSLEEGLEQANELIAQMIEDFDERSRPA